MTIPRDNLNYIQDRFHIRNKRGLIVPFRPNPAQNYYWSKKTRRNLVLKARQKGISKLIDADQLVDCIRHPINAVVISHELGATQRLFAAVRGFIETAKHRPTTSIDSKSEIRFPMRGSSYFIGTAGQKAFGRGDTIARAHLSEAAFYADLEKIVNGIAEAAEYGQIDIETTANGREEFHDMWQKAKSGKSSYTPIFIPWFIGVEYSVENMTEKERKGLSASVQEMTATPDDQFIASLDPEEKALVARVADEWKILLTPGQLKWRRYKIWDKGMLFFQEYPEDDVSCFLQSGRSVFSKVVVQPNRRIPLDDIGSWRASDEEKDALGKRRLYGGVDGSEGTPTGDAQSFSVLDFPDASGTGAVIFDMTSNDPIDVFCLKVAKVCRDFNITLGVEKNGVGAAHVRQFEMLGIPFEEWNTTASTRPVMVTELEEAYRKGELIESYPEAEDEMRDMEYGEHNRAEAKKSKHDDRVFSRAIAYQMRKAPQAGVSWL